MTRTPWVDGLRALPPATVIPTGQTAGALLELLTRPPTPDGAVFHPDVAYGTGGTGGRDLLLDLYAREDTSQRQPGVVFIHGGAWRSGDPHMHIDHAARLAARGYVTATIEYRLSPEALWPAALEDLKCAIRWMRANAAEIGLDPDRLAAGGGSAGGHLSALAALTPGQFEGSGGHEGRSSTIQAAVLWYPTLDLRFEGRTEQSVEPITQFLGDPTPERLQEASPVTYVSAGCPPILTMVGDDDPVSPIPQAEAFHASLTQLGVPNRLEVFAGPHGFDLDQPNWDRCCDLMIAFLDDHLAPAAPRRRPPPR
ncbi:MAG TPA: alpha/beta hydrolase [Nitriliruptorales bacterium]